MGNTKSCISFLACILRQVNLFYFISLICDSSLFGHLFLSLAHRPQYSHFFIHKLSWLCYLPQNAEPFTEQAKDKVLSWEGKKGERDADHFRTERTTQHQLLSF